MDTVVSKEVYAFEDFLLDAERRLLLRDGETINLHPKAFDLLLVLIENRDRVLSKTELLDLVWEGQFVEENNLAVQISTLRKIFGEKKDEHRFIVTVPNKGYHFVAKVNEKNEKPDDSFSVTATNSDKSETISNPPQSQENKTEISNRSYLLPLGIGVILIFAGISIYWFSQSRSESKQLKLSKLTTSGKITNAVLTHNGKYAVLAQKENEGESLWLKQIETGTQTRIAAPQAVEYVGLSVSPDDKYIYFSIFQDNQSGGWLRRMPLIGGATQEISGIDSGVAVSFSPDGKRFVFTESNSSIRETRLVTANADGSNPKILLRASDGQRKFPTYKANPVSWSPTNDEIACAVTEKNADGVKAGILLVNAETGNGNFLLSPRFAWIDNLVWTDAENLAFVASETDEWSSQIWTISKTTGEAKKITNDLNKYFWLSAANNSLLSIQENSVSSLQIADFDQELKEFQKREILNETGIDYVAFGADDSIYYVSQSSGKREIWCTDKENLNPIQLTTDAQVSYGFTVSPIDNSIFFSSAREGKHSLWRADSNGGNFRRLTDDDDIAPRISFDGKQIVFQRGLYDVPSVWKMSAADNQPSRLINNYSIKPAVSPDASKAAYYFMDDTDSGAWRIGLVLMETGEFLSKLSFPVTVNERRMVWHPNGKFLTQTFNSGDAASLLLLPADGGSPRIINNLGRGKINSFDWSRDGKKIVFSQTATTQDAVLLTQF